MKFFLGVHMTGQAWWDLGVPLCVSRRRMPKVKIPAARTGWILDSGGFSEIKEHGRWTTPESQYVDEVLRWKKVGHMEWCAPQDWMCEPWIVAKTGLTVEDHQRRTVDSYLSLREKLGDLVIPVVQGYGPRDYDRCIAMYSECGVALDRLPVVGLGSVCRRSRTSEIVRLIRYLSDHRIMWHGFGLKGSAIPALRCLLASADSMAWSFAARRQGRDSNSAAEAMAWRSKQCLEAA